MGITVNAACTYTGTLLNEQFGARVTYFLASMVFNGGFLLPALWPTLNSYTVGAVMNGLGTAMQYVLAMALCGLWMPEWRGMLNGVVVSGFAAGPLLWNW